MADSGEKINGLIIPVVVEADEKSPGIALHKLTKEFLSKLKDGYIDVPAKIDFGKANTKELSDKLEEVQDDFAAKWKAIAKKGFFADSDFISKEDKKELDDFIDSFKELQNITGKDKADKRKTAQWQKKAKGGKSGEVGSLKALSETIRKYEIDATREMAQLKAEVTESAKETEKEIKKVKKKGPTTSKKSTTRKGKSGGRRGKKLTATDIQKQWEARKARKAETEEQAFQELVADQEQIDNDIKQKGVGINERKAIIRPMLDKLAVKKTAGDFRESKIYDHMERRGLDASDWGGGHRSKFAEMQARTEKESQDLAEATYKQYNKGKDYANKIADEAIEKGHRNKRPKQYTQQDNQEALGEGLLKNVALVGGQLMGGVEGVTADTFKDAVATAMIDAMAKSKFEDVAVIVKSVEDAIKTMATNRFKSTGQLGVQKGDNVKGEGKNLTEWNMAMRDILQGFASLLNNQEFQSTWADIRTELTNIIKNIEDQEKANTKAIKNREKMPYKGKGLKGIYNSIKQGFEDLGNKLAGKPTRKQRIKAEGERLYGEKDRLAEEKLTAKEQLTNSNSYSELYGVIRNSLNPVIQQQKENTTATKTQTTFDKIENAREAVMDQKQNELSQENTTADIKTEETVKEDSGTGLNPDSAAKQLYDKITVNSKIADQTQQRLGNVITILEGLSTKLLDIGKGGTRTPLNTNTMTRLDETMCPCQSILEKILNETHTISVYADSMAQNLKGMAKEWGIKEENRLPALIEGQEVKDKTEKEIDKTNYQKLAREHQERKDSRERAEAIVRNAMDKYRTEKAKKDEADAKQKKLDDMYKNINAQNAKINNTAAQSRVTMSPFQFSNLKIYGAIKKAFGIDDTRKNAREISKMTQSEQESLRAERIAKFGLSRGGRNTDTGDIAQTYRTKRNYGWGGKNIENPFANLNLTDGIDIDTTEITEALQNAIQKNMFNAQTGGVWRNIIGSMTGYIGMPSLEKSRAEADAANQIMANIRDTVQDILNDIMAKETDLKGMESRGEAKFENGKLVEDNSRNGAATKLFADLEEQKIALRGVLADAASVDEVVRNTGGNLTKILQQLGFVAPELRKNNTIIQNINAGLDKNGKALKFQTRMAEILNYTFQLIGRSIGQWFKRLISMLNPFNILKNLVRTIVGWVKSAFQDFASYDTKWQRTMNVIKINFQRAIKPAMEWIAQKLVNIIGFFNIISMKVQEAFGKKPVDLFDQAGANAEKMRRELEKAANVTAGFDELHDIGSDNSGENDLLGSIYKPQLSQEWIDRANEIGDLLAGLIKGEKTIGEVLGRIFEMVLELLGKIAKAIWDWFKKTSLGKWLIDNWKKILNRILAAFLAWKLLKIAGPMLLKALFSWMTGGKVSEVFGKLGTKFMDVFTSTQFGSDFVRGIKSMFTSGGMIGTFKMGGQALGTIFAQSLVAVVGVAIAGIAIGVGGDKMRKNTAYNQGIDSVGGDDKDKKSNAGAAIGTTLGTTAGLALTGLAIGGPIGAAIGAGIGAIAGVLTTVLAPAIEKAEIKARDMNNELQKIEYYEGAVQGASSQVDIFDEQLQLLKESLKLSTQAVYEQGEKLGISKTRMEELVKATQDGTFTTDMLRGSETELSSSLTDLAQKQEHTTEVTKKLEDAQKKLLKAQTDLSIMQDIEAGNFEIAAARIEVAEAQGVYSTEEATKKRIQLYKQGGEEERKNLLQNLTQDQRQKMTEYNAVTEDELANLIKAWRESGQGVKDALLSGVDADTQQKFREEMDNIDKIIKDHQGFWQGVGDTLKEIFTFGNSTTWTYNGEDKYADEVKKGKYTSRIYSTTYAVGTNYVPNDQLAYLHKGEAVIPAKYNQGAAYKAEGNMKLEESINQLNKQVAQIGEVINQGIKVQGQFIQRGTDLVASVEKTNNKISNAILNNKVYAR